MLLIIWNCIEVQFLNLFTDTFQCFLLLETEMVIYTFESVLWSSCFRMFTLLSLVAHNSSEKLWICLPLYAMDIAVVVQMKLKK